VTTANHLSPLFSVAVLRAPAANFTSFPPLSLSRTFFLVTLFLKTNPDKFAEQPSFSPFFPLFSSLSPSFCFVESLSAAYGFERVPSLPSPPPSRQVLPHIRGPDGRVPDRIPFFRVFFEAPPWR